MVDIDRKRELLGVADSISKDISNQGCGNYVPLVINCIKIAKNKNDKSQLLIILNKMKKSEAFGGASQKDGFISFVDNIFKNPSYKINSMTFEEMEFLFSWVRRIVKDKAENKGKLKRENRNSFFKNNNSGNYKSNSYKSRNDNSRTNNKNESEDNPFAALTKLKF